MPLNTDINVQRIRSLIQDKPQFAQQDIVLNTALTLYRLNLFPIVAGTIIIQEQGMSPPPLPQFNEDDDAGTIEFVADPPAVTVTVQYKWAYLSDETIQDIIAIENLEVSGADPKLIFACAADCLDAIAGSQALIQKKITNERLSMDGPALAAALQKQAAQYRDLIYNPAFQESTFDIIEQVNDIQGYREKILKDWMRDTP